MIERTATELSQLLARGETTSEAVTSEFLKAIKQRDEPGLILGHGGRYPYSAYRGYRGNNQSQAGALAEHKG